MVLSWLRLPAAEPPVRSALWPLVWIGGTCAAGSIIALLVTYFSMQSGTEHLFIAYAGGVAAIVATGFVLAALGNRLYRRLA
jgi:hypothetical protein